MTDKGKRTLTPKLRFPEFRDEPGWDRKLLRSIATPVTGKADAESEHNVLTLSAEHGIVLQSDYFGKKVAGSDPERYIKITRNDFVYNDRTTSRSKYGTIRRLTQHDSGIVSPIYKCFRFNDEEFPEFWQWYFESGTHDAELAGLVNEGARAGRFNISPDKFLSTAAWCGSHPEQQKIAECLSSLDGLIAAEGRKWEALKAHKKGLMQQLFPRPGETRPRLRFPDYQNATEWTARELGPMTIKVGSGITPRGGEKNYRKDGRPFIRSQNVGWGKLLLDDVAYIDEDTHKSFDATELQVLDVLLNITGASIGRSTVADSRVRGGNVNQHVCIIRAITEELNPNLLNQYLISQDGQEQIDGFQAGGNRQGLNFGQIRSFLIPLPPTSDEQQLVAACLSSMDRTITAEAQWIEALQTHKKGLMQQLFPSPEEAET